MPFLYTTISSGQKVSADVDLRKYPRLLSIDFPVMTSGDLYLQGNQDTTSAGFHRLADNVGAIANKIGAGSLSVMWPAGYQHPSYLRAESLTTQTDVRTLTFSVRGFL